MKNKEKAYLFGPFVGLIDWEFYRFAPFAIYLKKKDPSIKMIVLTRFSSFDFYGLYADFLVNLNIEDDIDLKLDCFKSGSVSMNKYYKLATVFRKKYEKKYEIKGHFFPDIKYYRYKLRWQFPRTMMSYDFRPRRSNELILNQIIDSTCSILVDFSWIEDSNQKNFLLNSLNENGIEFIDYENIINNIVENKYQTIYGVSILLLNRMKLLVGNIDKSSLTKLGLLLKVPIITINEKLTEDSISLLNPFKTKVKFCDSGELNENFI